MNGCFTTADRVNQVGNNSLTETAAKVSERYRLASGGGGGGQVNVDRGHVR